MIIQQVIKNAIVLCLQQSTGQVEYRTERKKKSSHM